MLNLRMRKPSLGSSGISSFRNALNERHLLSIETNCGVKGFASTFALSVPGNIMLAANPRLPAPAAFTLARWALAVGWFSSVVTTLIPRW